MDKDKELSKLKKKILKFNKNFPKKNLVFADRPDKNRKPTPKEINEFKKLLFKHIEIISPKCILLLGATAAAAVLNHIGPLSEVRGKWKNIKIINSYFDILTTFHPAFLLRQPARKKSTLEDLHEFKRKLSS
ncbi:MAG: hypothetical protein EBV90_04295 [Candidatus Fonsibacter ubiquis]|nr:hypothetical protein [Candidatus Fonsibacter ubiquis]